MSTAIANTGTAMLGYPQRGLFSVRFAGLDGEGIPTFYGANNEIVYDMNLQSRNDVDKILKYEGPLEPKGYGGLTNTFRYKDWTLSFSSFPKELKNRWIMPGDENRTSVPAILDKRTYDRIEGKYTYQMYNKSTERMAKGDFIRLKDLSIGYRFPKEWLTGTCIHNVVPGNQPVASIL